ncbi:FAD/NAD(P)-binding domain-containing protein [Aspergillus unguis]
MDAKGNTTFRVVIVGAGPVGLYLAHTLFLANIDFIILERNRTVLRESGQIIVVWPQSMRLLDQIGLAKSVMDQGIAFHGKKRVYGRDGGVFTSSDPYTVHQWTHGYVFKPILRTKLVRLLYDSLPSRERRIKTSAGITNITTGDAGVQVHLQDGTVEHGSIVIGADGVHSQTRSIMQSLAGNDQNPMVPSFNGIFGRASNLKLGIGEAFLWESRGGGTVIQAFATKESVNFATLTAVPDTGKPVQQRYSAEEMEAHAVSIGHVAVAPGIRFRDLWAHADKSSCMMLNQEEGLLGKWYHGRIVLVGDAVYKTTSVNGLGLTLGMHSAAALANELQALVEVEPRPTEKELQWAFSRYQTAREGEVQWLWKDGYGMIRELSTDAWRNWLYAKIVLPWWDLECFAWGLVVALLIVSHGQVLQYVPFKENKGVVAWRNAPKT